MNGLNIILDLANYQVTDPKSLATSALFLGLAYLNFRISIPNIDKIAVYLKAGRSRIARAPSEYTHHKRLSVLLPLMFGAWAFVIFSIFPADSLAYIQDGIVLWPDFGRVAPWLINIVIGVALLGGAGLVASYVHYFGVKSGLVSGFLAIGIYLASFIAGVLAGPATLLAFFIFDKGMYIGTPVWAFKRYSGRLAGQSTSFA